MTTAGQSPHAAHGGQGPYKGCKHPECLAYRERYRKRWAYERAHGQKRIVDAAAARRQVDTLIGMGWSNRSIAAAAGVAAQSITRLRHEGATVTRKVEAKVLAVELNQVPSVASKQTSEPFVPRIGSVRRIQALLAMGWTHADISQHSGVRSAVMLHQRGRWVTRTNHDRMAATYAALAMTPGPSETTRRRAVRLGYLGPLAWESVDLDAEPQTDELSDTPVDAVAVQRRMSGDLSVRLNRFERLEMIRQLHAQGHNDQVIMRLTGVHADQVRRDRLDLDLTAIVPGVLVSSEHFSDRGARRREQIREAS